MFFTTTVALAKAECPNGEHWVAPHFRIAYVRYDGVHVSAAQVRGHCRKNPRGYIQWHERLANQRPAIWSYGKEKSKKWTLEEVQRFYEELSALPDSLINIKNVKVYRMDQSLTQSNPATSNFRDIVLYDGAFKHKDSLAQIIAHELAHTLFAGLSDSEKEQFAEETNWIVLKLKNETIYIPKNEKKLLQADSTASIDEDFANHIEAFLFDKAKLRKVSPNSILWIQKKYGESFRIQKRDEK